MNVDYQKVYRLYNDTSYRHFYTNSEDEIASAINQNGYRYEGVAFRLLSSNQSNSKPVYRLVNEYNANHLYTTDDAEVSRLTNGGGWKQESVLGYALEQRQPNTTELYRLYNNTDDHFYTIDVAEYDNAIQHGYHLEGIVGYVYDDLQKVYRFLYNNQHFYTASYDEGATRGYYCEGIGFRVLCSQISNYTKPLYHLVQSNDKLHFYTTDQEEFSRLTNGGGWQNDGTVGYVYREEIGNTTALYRFCNSSSNDHFYTTSQGEKDFALSNGYKSEGIIGYVYARDNSRWMEELYHCSDVFKNKKLHQIVIPGSHDSGSYQGMALPSFSLSLPSLPSLPPWLPPWLPFLPPSLPSLPFTGQWKGMTPLSITQFRRISQQLYSGIRFLDLRFTKKEGKFMVSHGIDPIGPLISPLLQDVLQDIHGFMIHRPNEIVILNISHLDFNDQPHLYQELFDAVLTELSGLLIPKPASVEDVSIQDIFAKQQRIILASNVPLGSIPAATSAFIWYNSGKISEDYYNEELYKEENVDKVFDYIRGTFNSPPVQLSVCQTLLTPNISLKTLAPALLAIVSGEAAMAFFQDIPIPLKLAALINPRIPALLWSMPKNLNIVISDFFTDDFVYTAIILNSLP